MIKIFTTNETSPEFIEPQLASFKKYLQEDFEFYVCSGGENKSLKPEESRRVAEMCASLAIPVIDIQRDDEIELYHTGVTRTANKPVFTEEGRYGDIVEAGTYTLQWVWERVISKERGPICFVHSDVFLIEPIRLTDYLKDHMLCSVMMHADRTDGRNVRIGGHIDFLWEPFTIADMSRLPAPETMMWWPARVEGTWGDTGIQTYYYLQRHPEINLLEVHQGSYDDDPTVDFHPSRYQYFTIEGKKILHYMAGSRWATETAHNWGFSKVASDEYHNKKLAWARKLIGLPENV